jgi:aldehyde dehydrogenase (NAD+)
LDQKKPHWTAGDKDSVSTYLAAIEKQKRKVEGSISGRVAYFHSEGFERWMLRKTSNHLEPKIIFEIVQHETFAPILYLMKYSGEVENAIDLQNGVAQGFIICNHDQRIKRSRKILVFLWFRLWNC